jgi:hypothetical protein
MKNDRFGRVHTYFGEQLATTFSTENVLAKIEERYNALLPELPGSSPVGPDESEYKADLKVLVDYAETDPRSCWAGSGRPRPLQTARCRPTSAGVSGGSGLRKFGGN